MLPCTSCHIKRSMLLTVGLECLRPCVSLFWPMALLLLSCMLMLRDQRCALLLLGVLLPARPCPNQARRSQRAHWPLILLKHPCHVKQREGLIIVLGSTVMTPPRTIQLLLLRLGLRPERLVRCLGWCCRMGFQ